MYKRILQFFIVDYTTYFIITCLFCYFIIKWGIFIAIFIRFLDASIILLQPFVFIVLA